MPRLPLQLARPGPRAGAGRRATALDLGGGQGLVPYGAGLQDAGQAAQVLGQIGARLYDAEQRSRVDRATAETARRLSKAVEDIEASPDHDTYLERYEAERDRARNELGEGVAEDYRGLYGENVQAIDDQLATRLRQTVRERQIESIRADTVSTFQTYADQEAQAKTPEDAALWRGLAAGVRDRAVLSQAMTPEEAGRHWEAYGGTVTRAKLLQGIGSNPRATLAALEARSGPYADIGEVDRQEAIVMAQRAVESQIQAEYAALSRGLKLQKEAERLESQAAERELLRMLDPQDIGAVPMEEVFQRLERLSPEAGLRWQKIAAEGGRPGAAVRDDPVTFTDLRDRARAGEPIFEDATAAYQDGALTKTTYDTLLDESSAGRFKPVDEWLHGVVQPRGGMYAVYAEAEKRRAADAEIRFDFWKRENPKATLEEAFSQAQIIARQAEEGAATAVPIPKASSTEEAEAAAIDRALARAGFPMGTTPEAAEVLDPVRFRAVAADERLDAELRAIEARERAEALGGKP